MTAETTAKRYFRSAGAAAFSQFWRIGVAFLARLFLRRWIPVEDWGLWDWALTLFLVLGALRDLGLLYHVVRVKPRPYFNMLAVELGWGGLLAAASVLLAPVLAGRMSNPHPDAVGVLQALGVFLLAEGLAAVPKTYFEAELKIGRTVFPEILRNLVFVSLSLGMAYTGYGVWSLVVGQVAGAVVYAVHLWWRAVPGLPLHWQHGQTFRLIRQSLPLASIWLLFILIQNVDPLIVRARFDFATTGGYTFAYQTAFLAALVIVPGITRALYPALVAFRDDPERFFEAYRLATLFVIVIEAPAAFFLFANAELVIAILGGGQWGELSPPLLRLLCLAPLVDPIGRLGGEVLKTLHRDRLWIVINLMTLGSFVFWGWTLTGSSLGPRGMAWANFLPLGAVVMAWSLYRVSPSGMRQLLGELAWLYILPAIVFLPIFALVEHQVLRFGISLLALGGLGAFFWRRFGHQFRNFLSESAAAAVKPS